MRKIGAVLFLFLACTAHIASADSTESAPGDDSFQENRLDTLHHRAPQGHYDLSASVRFGTHDAETISKNGTSTFTDSRSSLQTSATLAYGLTDKFLVSVGESYLFNNTLTETNVANGNQSIFKSEGFSDPTLHANYRFKGDLKGDQFASGFFDLVPVLGTAKNASTTEDGNNLSVSNEASVGVNYYWVMHVHEWLLEGAGHYRTSGLNNNPSGGSTSSNSYMAFDILGTYRYHFMEKFYGQAAVNYRPGYSISANNANSSWTDTYSPILTSTLELGWHPSPTMIAFIYYTYSGYTATQAVDSGTGTSTSYAYIKSFLSLGGTWEF